ncbi:hypothetical protein DND132_1534 [Pseudodesulfovibrio mercurii]|uniref:Uncharacterized protein n=1 Tax=Pseudodesulfovibrio mercurii TaxID=641491 RepID=F0JEL2_9BACT|nr:hypothetical protein [Pseudodesulfovibrio mercurii]EGB14741.1 hypothetical protein DND132_1534 [Pseudodesulfovibrio mercurii]
MKRRIITDTFHTLLRRAHAARPAWQPDRSWRDAVLLDAARLHASAMNLDLDRLAPRFTVAAAAVSGVSLLTAFWVLRDLSGQILSALTSQALHYGLPGLGI